MNMGLFERSVLFKVEYIRLFFFPLEDQKNNKKETNIRARRDAKKWKRKQTVLPKATPIIRTVYEEKNQISKMESILVLDSNIISIDSDE